MKTTIHHDKKENRIRITFDGRRVQTREMGMVTQGGTLGYVKPLRGGVLVSDMFNTPVRIFPEGEEQNAVDWLISTLK